MKYLYKDTTLTPLVKRKYLSKGYSVEPNRNVCYDVRKEKYGYSFLVEGFGDERYIIDSMSILREIN